jgi:hypothetical protein
MNHPLRLATGSHRAGSGKGCAMNVVSWENGDTTITDYPACADRMLAAVVQRVNDLLCAACSIDVLALAHRTAGSADVPLTDEQRRVVWVKLACLAARDVAHMSTDPRVMRAIEAAETWANNPTTAHAGAYTAAHAAHAAAADADAHAAAAAHAADAAAHAAHAAAADAHAAHVAYACAADAHAAYFAYVAYACAAKAAAADAAAHVADADARMSLAHRLIDEFNRLTGRTEHATEPAVTRRAVAQMCEVR